jgi:hypothetical protein
MRALLFWLCLIAIGFSAILRTAHFAVLYAFKISFLGIYPPLGASIQAFGQPFPIAFAGDAFYYISIAASVITAALALRRIVLLVRTRWVAPSSFRGASYVLSYIALGFIAIAAAMHLGGLGIAIPLMVLSPAHVCLVLAFFIHELGSFGASGVAERPNTTAETDARKGGARGSP